MDPLVSLSMLYLSSALNNLSTKFTERSNSNLDSQLATSTCGIILARHLIILLIRHGQTFVIGVVS